MNFAFQHTSIFPPRNWTGSPKLRTRTWTQKRLPSELKRSTKPVKNHYREEESTEINHNGEEQTITRDGTRATNATVVFSSIIKEATIHNSSDTTAHNSILRTETTEADMEGQMQEVTPVVATAATVIGHAGNVKDVGLFMNFY